MIAASPDDGTLHIRRAWLAAAGGKRDAAGAGIDRALSIGPCDRCLDILVQHAVDAWNAGRGELALWAVDLALAKRPSDWRLHSYRSLVLDGLGRPGETDAEMEHAAKLGADLEFLILMASRRLDQGRWAEAAALYSRARHQSMIIDEDWLKNVSACLLARDLAGYRSVCADALAGYKGLPLSGGQCLFLTELCTVGPGAIDPDGSLLGRLATLAATMPPTLKSDWRNAILGEFGAALYRIGRYRDAHARLGEAIAALGGQGTPRDQVFLAMANERIGNRDEALRCLAKLPPTQDFRSTVFDPEIEVLREEARSLILEATPFPADHPFAPTPTRGANR
jgi:hypothetical protein